MATETLRPDGELSDSGLVTNSELDHDEDPDVSSATVNATGNNTNTNWGGDFPTPTGDPTVGTDLQEFRVGVLEFDSGQSGAPDARIELWENGTLVRAGSNTPVSTYAVLSFKWNANELATADGSLVQCVLVGTKSGGSPTARNTVRIGHMEWNATVDSGGTTFFETHSMTTTPVVALVKTVGILRAITVTPVVVLARIISLAVGMTTTPVAAVVKQIEMARSMSTTPVAALTKAKLFLENHVMTTTPIVSLVKTVGIFRSMTTTPVVALARTINLAIAMTTTPIVAVVKQIEMARSMTTTPVVGLAKVLTAVQNFVISTTLVVALARTISLVKSITATPVVSFAKVATIAGAAAGLKLKGMYIGLRLGLGI